MRKRKLGISIDISKDNSQLCYYTDGMQDSKSVSSVYGEERYDIPLSIAKACQREVWYIGEVALQYMERGNALGITDLFDIVSEEQTVEIEERSYTSVELLTIYIQKLLEYLPKGTDLALLTRLVVSMECPDRLWVFALTEAFNRLEISGELVEIISRSESFFHYCLFQKKEFRTEDVLVFDFCRQSFTMKRLHVTEVSQGKMPVTIEEKDYSNRMRYGLLADEQGRIRIDRLFAGIVEEECSNNRISTIYLNGSGFMGNWMKHSLTILCKDRRVFLGSNLFSKGGMYCISAREGKGEAYKYLLLCKGRTIADIELEVLQGGEKRLLPLSKAGTHWYEAGAMVDCILDYTKLVVLRVTSAVTGESRTETVELQGLPKRPNRTTRIGIILSYQEDGSCLLFVRDKGFGDFYPTSDVCVRKEVQDARITSM